jgi:hypothetical protein
MDVRRALPPGPASVHEPRYLVDAGYAAARTPALPWSQVVRKNRNPKLPRSSAQGDLQIVFLFLVSRTIRGR